MFACAARRLRRRFIYDFICVKAIRFYGHFLTPSVASGSMPRTGWAPVRGFQPPAVNYTVTVRGLLLMKIVTPPSRGQSHA